MTAKPCHFYVVFNPLFNKESHYETQAHEFYYDLKERIKADPKAYLYWGKIKFTQNSEPLNLNHFQQVMNTNIQNKQDTHLYITDYKHIWVGKVEQVLKDIPDKENTLPIYKQFEVEAWFKISDFDLISSDANETALYLSYLYVNNPYYPKKLEEINPYVSGLRFPMIVQDNMNKHHFGYYESETEKITHRIQLTNTAIELPTDSWQISKTLQSYVIPERNFKRLPDVVRNQIINAELTFAEANKHSSRMTKEKMEELAGIYLRCLEVTLNATFVSFLKKEHGQSIFVKRNSSCFEFLKTKMIDAVPIEEIKENASLGQVFHLIQSPFFFNNGEMEVLFKNKKSFWLYCRNILREHFKNYRLLDVRNLVAHGRDSECSLEQLLEIRNVILGVGSAGILNELISEFHSEASARPDLKIVKKAS